MLSDQYPSFDNRIASKKKKKKKTKDKRALGLSNVKLVIKEFQGSLTLSVI